MRYIHLFIAQECALLCLTLFLRRNGGISVSLCFVLFYSEHLMYKTLANFTWTDTLPLTVHSVKIALYVRHYPLMGMWSLW